MKNRGRRAGSRSSQTLAPARFGAASTARALMLTLDALAEGVIVHDYDGQLVDCNLAAQHILELTIDQIAERAPLDPRWAIVREDGSHLPPESYPYRVTLRTHVPQQDVVIGVQREDRRTTWIAVNTILFQTEVDAPLGVISTFRDISERKRSEEREHEGRVRLELAAKSGNVGFWDWDLATNATVFSDEWKSQLGYLPHEISNNYVEWESRLHPDDRERAIQRVQHYLEGSETD